MPTARRINRPAIAAALALGLAAPAALAQDIDGGPTPAGKTAAAEALDRPSDAPQPSADTDATTTDAQAAPEDQGAAITGNAPSAAALNRAIAKWARAIGGRICIGPRLLPGDRVSKPDVRDQAQGWIVSVPTFADARLSRPPDCKMPEPQAVAGGQAQDEPAGDQPDNQTGEVKTAAEPGGN